MLAFALRLLVALLLAGGAARAAMPEDVSDADRAAIRAVIEAQIEAFRSDDAATAFSFATPDIQAQFGDPDHFMAMVRQGYRPVYRPRTVEFGSLGEVHGKLMQRVLIVDPEDTVHAAYYVMQKQPDGAWRIDGCILQPASDRAI
jgi:hypothetical protein